MAAENLPQPGQPSPGQPWRPVPDPTELTTQALLREIAALKELIFTRLDGNDRAILVFNENLTRVPTATDRAVAQLKELQDTRIDGVCQEMLVSKEVIFTRFDGMDRALKLLQDIADRFPDRIDEKISSLKEIHDGQFHAIQQQFAERDTRTEQISKQSEVAINAALQAAKEAVAEQNRSSALAISKSEAATDKRIDQIGALVQTATGALDGKITDIKDRLIIMEGRILGQATQKGEQRDQTGATLGLWMLGIAIVSILIGLAFRFMGR
jgi:hypothetical protein